MKVKLLFIIFLIIPVSLISGAQERVDTREKAEVNDTTTLDDVIVKGAKKLTTMDAEGLVTDVRGTILQKVGTARDILMYIPGVMCKDGSIEVIGAGTPVIYINGRRVFNTNELDQLRSERIKNVKVISNPGARYGADVKSVIRITADRNQGVGFSFDSKSTVGYNDYFYGKELLKLNYRHEGLDIFFIGKYENSKDRGSVTSIQNIWAKTHTRTEDFSSSKSRMQLFEGKFGMNYMSKSGHCFGAFYQSQINPTNTTRSSFISYYTDYTEEGISNNVSQSSNTKTKFYQHLIDGYYSGEWGKWSAELNFDLLWKDNKDAKRILETELNIDGNNLNNLGIRNDYYFFNKSSGRMYAGEFNISHKLWTGKIDFGASLSLSHRVEDNLNPDDLLEDYNNLIKEGNYSLYAQTTQRLSKFSFLFGLRFEHVVNAYYVNGEKLDEMSRSYNEFLPSLNITANLGQSMFQIGYSRSYIRPLFAQLRSAIAYVNEYVYETGNPDLKTTYLDRLSLNYMYRWFMFGASYKHYKDRILNICEPYHADPQISVLKKINSPKGIDNLEFFVSINPGKIGKVFYPSIMGALDYSLYKMEYRGNLVSRKHPICIVNFNNVFVLPRNYMLTLNMQYRSKGESENVLLGQTWQVDFSALKSVNQNWDIKLSVNDIFNTARKNNFTIYSSIIEMMLDKRINTRRLELTIGYKFNVVKSKYKGKGAGKSVMERL